MFAITHTSPARALSQLRKLQREGEAMLGSRDLLTPFDPCRWDARLVDYLRRIAANPSSVDDVVFRDMPALSMEDFNNPPEPTRRELDEKVRSNISRSLTILAGYIEQLEAVVENEDAKDTKT
jgi:hypothetical protein